jgi:arginyl-tRNA synthetase
LKGDLTLELGDRVAAAVEAAFGLRITAEEAVIRAAAPDRPADYQCNAAFALAKRVGAAPLAVAGEIASHLEADLVEPPVVAGAGFVNLTLRRSWLEGLLVRLQTDARLGVPPSARARRVVIDYGAPNIAKELHAGHLRSTVIGDAIARLLRFSGDEVIAQNHLGDWGTPFGMLLEHLVDLGWTQTGAEHSIRDLDALYKAARAKFNESPVFAERSRRRVVLLQGGDAGTLELWSELVAASIQYFQHIYDVLGVLLRPEDARGESFYNPFLGDVVEELQAKGLLVESEGALCVFPPGFKGRDGSPQPLIVRKSDGGFNYEATDLAALRFRTQELHGEELLYVIQAAQHMRLQMLFATGRLAGWVTDAIDVQHVSFGALLGEDGKILKTREGESVKLVDLIDEGIARARRIVEERSQLEDGEREEIARAVGIGALKYADLAGDRQKDHVFAWDRLLAMDGNTAVYLQYANARIRSVIRRGGEEVAPGTRIVLGDPSERALGLRLAQFGGAVRSATEHLEPHRLCTHLYETATAFTAFYERCSVLSAETDELRQSRLALCGLTSRALILGLSLLGIEAPERL